MNDSGSDAVRSVETLQVALEPTPSLDYVFTHDFGFLPIPKHLRYDPQHPPHFGLLMNITFGVGGTFIVANLYYCQPILIQLAQSFNVDYNKVSRIPTLMQAGYAIGLLLISPAGDFTRRRQLILLLIFASASLTIGLAITRSLIVFEVLSFFVGVFTVIPQILMPLAADLAPPHRRATAIAVVSAGLLAGVLIARVLAGIVAQFVTLRVVYYLALGLQYFVLLILYLVIPDYPAKNKGTSYWKIFFGMLKLAVTEPLLIQGVFIVIGSSAAFGNFWVTLTFLLGEAPYNYSTLVIGIFGLVGLLGVAMAPLVGLAVDRLVPWSAIVVSTFIMILIQAIQVGAGGVNIAVVIIVAFGLDVLRQMQQVSITSAVLGLDANARSRLNAVLSIAFFLGQVMGTSASTKVFTQYGWRAGAALALAWLGWSLAVVLMRGPHCKRYTWFGYEGGCEMRKRLVEVQMQNTREEAEFKNGKTAAATEGTSTTGEQGEGTDRLDEKTSSHKTELHPRNDIV